MRIRAQKLSATTTRTAEEWKDELSATLAAASGAVSVTDAAGFRAAFVRVAEWNDPHRRLQGDLHLCDLLVGVRNAQPRSWAPLYYEAAFSLLESLRRDPLEPTRWNLLGVALFELGQTQAAERCWRAVRKLQPDHPNLRQNLRGVKDRRRRTIKLPFGTNFLQRVGKLADAARVAADAVKAIDPATQKLSLVMIVRDEEEMLEACLDSVKDVVDEMVIVDTGSTDRTVQIAESFGANVIHFPWTGSFAEARNVSLDNATGDWVLHLDADERIVPEDAHRIRPLLSRVYREGFILAETNYTGETGGQAAVTHAALRIWKHRPEYRFEGAIHEQKSQNMPTWLRERFEDTGIRMLHFGYLKEVINARGKSQRNLELLLEEAKTQPTPFNRFNIGSEYLQLGDPEQARAYFDQAWDDVRATPEGLRGTGFGPMLAQRAARARREAGDVDGAQKLIDEALPVYPAHTDLVYEAALTARDRGDLQAAIALGEKMLKMGDAPVEYAGVVGLGSYLGQMFVAEMHEHAGQADLAVSMYRQTLEEHPEFVGVVPQLARAELNAGADPDKLVAELTPLTDRHLGTAGLLLAHTLYEHQLIDAARTLYEQVLAASPANPAARVGLIECALSSGDLTSVRDLTAQIDDDDPAAFILLRAALFVALLRPDQDGVAHAERLLSRAEPLRLPSNERETFQAWVALLHDGSVRPLSAEAAVAAASMLNAALRLTETDASEQLMVLVKRSQLPTEERIRLLAETLFRAGYLESAGEEWLEWIDDLGVAAVPVLGLAQIELAQGRRAQALALAEDALELEPDSADARRFVDALS